MQLFNHICAENLLVGVILDIDDEDWLLVGLKKANVEQMGKWCSARGIGSRSLVGWTYWDTNCSDEN